MVCMRNVKIIEGSRHQLGDYLKLATYKYDFVEKFAIPSYL
ncbi:hypothetical protein Plhal304r1_c062g0149841 [Plasmopara halstedii]